MEYRPKRCASGAYMKSVSPAILSCFSRFMLSSVRMLCSRSAILMRITRMSSLSVSSIFRKFSAWALCAGSKIPEILVNPSMMARSRLPNIRSMSSSVTQVSSTVSCSSAHTMLVVSSPISSRKIRATADGMKNVRFPTAPPHVLVRLHRQLPRLADPLAVLLPLALLRRTQQPPVLPGQVAFFCFGIGEDHG